MLGPGEKWPWEQWVAAWRGLPGNPLAQYFRLTEARRLSRIPPWRRRLPLLLTFLLCAGLLVLGISQNGGQVSTSEFGWSLLLLAIPLYLVWLFQGLFEAMSAALHVLGPPGRQRLQLHMDDLLALTTLRDEEIVLAGLSVVLPPLWARAAAGAALVWGIGVLIVTGFGTRPFSDEVLAVFTWAPVTIGCIGLAGMLAATALSLVWLSLGRDLRAELMAIGGMFSLMLVQAGWYIFSGVMIFQGGMNWDGTYVELQPTAAVVGITALLAVMYLQLAFAQVNRTWRAALTLAGPLAMPFLLLLLVNGWTGVVLIDDGPLVNVAMTNFAWSWGALVPLNPVALFSLRCLGIDAPDLINWSYGQGAEIVAPWRFGLLLLAQAALIMVCASAARESVARRRRGL